MKSTLKLAAAVLLLALTAWLGAPRTSEAAYPLCSSISDCSATAQSPWRACWSPYMELYICACSNYRFVCQ
jgi:hypothetical protein